MGIISTVAGNGKKDYSRDGKAATSAELNWPCGVAVDDSGNIYIADTFNNRIRKVSRNGIISTIAGNGKDNGYLGDDIPAKEVALYEPAGIALDKSGNIYIAGGIIDLRVFKIVKSKKIK